MHRLSSRWDVMKDTSRGKMSGFLSSYFTVTATQLLNEKVSRHCADPYIITTVTDVDAPDVDPV